LKTPDDPALAAQHQAFTASLQQCFELRPAGADAESNAPGFDGPPMEQAYQDLKATVLTATAAGAFPLSQMERLLSQYSALRRAAQQVAKARERLQRQCTG
jgi:hypothetical protein